MIIPDINLLLYAYDAASPFHPRASVWWSNCLSGAEPVAFPSVVIFSLSVKSLLNAIAHRHADAEANRALH